MRLLNAWFAHHMVSQAASCLGRLRGADVGVAEGLDQVGGLDHGGVEVIDRIPHWLIHQKSQAEAWGG